MKFSDDRTHLKLKHERFVANILEDEMGKKKDGEFHRLEYILQIMKDRECRAFRKVKYLV